MDAFIKNTFNKISPAYELIADVTVGVATTQVDFSGLNFGKDDELLLVSDIVNPVALDISYRLFVNGNYTNTNYWFQQLIAASTTIAGGRGNGAEFVSTYNTSKVFSDTKIKLSNNGYFVFQSKTNREYGGGSMFIVDYYGTSTFTSTSITSLRVASPTANTIGIGSRFQLYRLKANKVVDITVSSATTQVDITGLNIDKDSEYMLVSDVVNGTATNSVEYYLTYNSNNTLTNYYSQYLYAIATGVGAGRVNNAFFTGANSNTKNLSITNIKLTNSGFGVIQSNIKRQYTTTNDNWLQKAYGTSNFTMTSITQLTIKTNVTNAIGIGSRFILYKMK